MSDTQKTYEELLAEAGLVKKEKIAENLTPEQKVAKVKELLGLLELAKKNKDESTAKKIRRTLRKKFGFKISEHKVVVA